MEQSRKFDEPALAALARSAGLAPSRVWPSAGREYLLIELVPPPAQVRGSAAQCGTV